MRMDDFVDLPWRTRRKTRKSAKKRLKTGVSSSQESNSQQIISSSNEELEIETDTVSLQMIRNNQCIVDASNKCDI